MSKDLFEELYAEEIAEELAEMGEEVITKAGADEHRRAKKATIGKINSRKRVAANEGLILTAKEKAQLKNHASYTHIDFNSDGSSANNRILSKESKGEISGWNMPNKRSTTVSMADVENIVSKVFEAEAEDAEALKKHVSENKHKEAVNAVMMAADKAVEDVKAEWNTMFRELGIFPR